jgi:hypothetical protein
MSTRTMARALSRAGFNEAARALILDCGMCALLSCFLREDLCDRDVT